MTHGKATENRNNHPFRSRDGRYFLVHNGILENHAEIDDRYRLRREGECDSESILRLIERVGDARKGLSTALRELRGSLSIGIYDSKASLLWLANNGGRSMNCCLLKREKGWIFASTSGIIQDALRKTYGEGYQRRIQALLPLSPYIIHGLSASGELIGV